MRKEKIILSFIATAIGLLIAVFVFFIYQKTKAISPSSITKITTASPTPSPSQQYFLTIDSPTDEQVVSNPSVSVSGDTTPGAKLLIITASTQESATPASDGHFSTDIVIESGENVLQIVSVMPDGETVTATKTVTYSTENF